MAVASISELLNQVIDTAIEKKSSSTKAEKQQRMSLWDFYPDEHRCLVTKLLDIEARPFATYDQAERNSIDTTIAKMLTYAEFDRSVMYQGGRKLSYEERWESYTKGHQVLLLKIAGLTYPYSEADTLANQVRLAMTDLLNFAKNEKDAVYWFNSKKKWQIDKPVTHSRVLEIWRQQK